jgi:hypothetical protein
MNKLDDISLVYNCISVINKNKNSYIPSSKITEEIDNYYDKYDDIEQILEDKFIRYVKEKIETDSNFKLRYELYGIKELEHWFYDDEFKSKINDIRDISNVEYYIYLTNKNNKNKIKDLEFKLYYITFLFIIITLHNVLNHIGIN